MQLLVGPEVIRAAGILFLAPERKVLFLKRGPGGDHPGEWCFPGGTTEGTESARQTAEREAVEECGTIPDGVRVEFARRAKDGVDFSTFIQRVDAEFAPTITGEHTGWAWASVDEPPQPLHPGAAAALAKLDMDELGIARAIAAGDLVSPQRYANMWLFAMRVTGTGQAYRSTIDEHVYRRPEDYLTQEFCERCAGIAVIWKHPPKKLLNSEEFAERVIGAIMFAYIVGDEVWGIARIHDAESAELMESEQLSTSPGVLNDPSANEKMTYGDGSKLLIEGKPSLLDHLAVCQLGVWDKGGSPAGIRSETRGDDQMTEAEQAAADAARKDAEEKAKADAAEKDLKLDKVLAALDSVSTKLDAQGERMDAMESKVDSACAKVDSMKKDEDDEPEPVVADKARKDAEEASAKEAKEKEEEEKKADAARADSIVDSVVGKLKPLLPKDVSDSDYTAMVDAQARADNVAVAFGESAPRPLQMESLGTYRRRLAGGFQAHSPRWKAINLANMDDPTFEQVEKDIYADAAAAGHNPATVPAGTLREIKRRDDGGREIKTFVGDPSVWLRPQMGQTRRVAMFNTERRA